MDGQPVQSSPRRYRRRQARSDLRPGPGIEASRTHPQRSWRRKWIHQRRRLGAALTAQEVQAVAICPKFPHIIASASRDHTIRIWNLYGYDVELQGPTDLPNQNYPMGDADEGNHVVAILAGNWPGGHRDDVCTLVSRRAALQEIWS